MPDQLKIIQRPFDAFLSNAEIVELQKRYRFMAVNMVPVKRTGRSSTCTVTATNCVGRI